MSAKSAKFRTSLYFTLAVFGVCSVSSESFAFSTSNNSDSSFSRNSGESAPKKNKKQKSSEPETSREDSYSPKSPFAPGSQNLSLGIGQIFLLGDYGNHYDNGIGPELHYDYGVSEMFAFESNFGYQSHSNGTDSSQTLSIWNVDAGLRANLMYFDQLIPFAQVGFGFYHPSFSQPNNTSLSSLLFGLQLGGGIDLIITKQLFFGAGLIYNDIFDSSKKDSTGKEVGIGGSYVSFMIHLGVTF